MDMQMPEMDGVTATTEILKQPQNNNLTIVAMTANVLEQDRNKCFDAGMTGFIGKPINIDDIAREIRALKG
jgi:two-component system sensor histidine kinase/response regulator